MSSPSNWKPFITISRTIVQFARFRALSGGAAATRAAGQHRFHGAERQQLAEL